MSAGLKQSRAMSLLESAINIAVGFALGLAGQVIFLPLLGVEIALHQNLVFAGIMTVISIARSFALRRLFEALHIRRPLSPAMLAVIAERYRQVDVEVTRRKQPPSPWPRPCEWWKPQGVRGDLVRAGALIIAEIERLDRLRGRRREK